MQKKKAFSECAVVVHIPPQCCTVEKGRAAQSLKKGKEMVDGGETAPGKWRKTMI